MATIRTPDIGRGTTDTGDREAAVEAVRERATPLTGAVVDQLAERVADNAYVLLGEASHGTSEFYRWRARLTARLVSEHGFDVVAVEGDWTDCYEINQYIRGDREADRGEVSERASGGPASRDADSAREVLETFERWPTWMWANWEVEEFVDWLREENAGREPGSRVGFYGMDVYSLFESMRAVVDYLEDEDPEAAQRAREAYTCFEPYREDAQEYARSLRMAPEDCKDEVIDVLTEIQADAPGLDSESKFAAVQNALVARNAEAYYRALVDADAESWNVRDSHMVETLERLREHHGPDSKVVVWAHNTHVGDARATDMTDRGEVNVGQLVRETVGPDETAIVGFGTHHGEVVAGKGWGEKRRRMVVPPAREGSYEDVLHRAGVGDSLLTFGRREGGPLASARGHRAIGVVYHPDRELGNYVPTVLPDRYDAFVFLDETESLHPIEAEDGHGSPDTYPWGV